MKINVKQLRSIIQESVKAILKEEESKSKGEETEDSVDRQIDRYFSSYEKEANSTKKEGLDFRFMSRSFFTQTLSEAEEENKGADKEKLSLEDIDVEIFADSVVRLIDNYDSLLEIRDTISKRAVNFLNENYDAATVQAFKDVLLEQYDIAVGKSQVSDNEKFQAPPADRASGSGGGGGA